jgi:rfaE bifunctional protein kinase chain/domain
MRHAEALAPSIARTRPAAPSAILIVGDCMLDRYWDGSVERISPEAPVPILHVRKEFERAGGAANVALNLVALGSGVALATLLGEDAAGRSLSALMADHGVALHAVSAPDLRTTQKIRSVCMRHQLLRIDFEEPPPPGCIDSIRSVVENLLPAHEWMILSDYGKGCLQRCEKLISAATRRGCKVLVDPKGTDFSRYRGAFVLKPNASELRAVVGEWDSEETMLKKAQALRAELGVEHLLVTRGELGMVLCSADRPCLRIPSEVREVYDVSGAGDTVLAVLAHCLAEGHDVESAVRWANKAAGIVVGKFGTASVSREELGLKSRVTA